MRVLIRPVKGKRGLALADLQSLTRKEIDAVLDRKVKPALIESHERIVAGWEHEIGFAAKKFVTPNQISMTIYPTGENAWLWNLVDHEGAEEHPITAVNAPRLVFPTGPYVSKTLAHPARVVSGGGYDEDDTPVFAKAVVHPGFEPRNFTRDMAEDTKPSYKAEIENAFRRVARQANS